MSPEPVPVVYCYVHFVVEDGSERVVRYVTIGDDEAAAARQAFEAIERGVNPRYVREIETYPNEPRRWDPRREVEEITRA